MLNPYSLGIIACVKPWSIFYYFISEFSIKNQGGFPRLLPLLKNSEFYSFFLLWGPSSSTRHLQLLTPCKNFQSGSTSS